MAARTGFEKAQQNRAFWHYSIRGGTATLELISLPQRLPRFALVGFYGTNYNVFNLLSSHSASMFLGITPISQHQVSEAQLERRRSCGITRMIGRDDTMMILETRHALRLWGGNAGCRPRY